MKRGQLVVAAAIILAAAAHVGWWYWPRERSGLPRPGSVGAAILADADLPVRAWVPYPHQNLGALERLRRRSEAVAGLAELPVPELPSFGPLATPPAHDLALAVSSDGSRMLLAARVYPTAAVLARWAGRLAGNPWLAGGTVGEGARRAVIEWRGSTWTVGRGVRLPEATAGPSGLGSPALGALALAQPRGPLPGGLYALRRRGDGLELATAGGEALDGPGSPAGAEKPPLFVLERTEGAVEGLALLGRPAGSDLPRWAVFRRGRGPRPIVPGESLYELLGRDPLTARSGDARLAGTDDEALRTAGELAVRAGAEGPFAHLRFVALGDLAATAAALGPLVEQLSHLPLEETRRWAALLAAARSLDDWSRVTVLVADGPSGAASVRLERGAAGGRSD